MLSRSGSSRATSRPSAGQRALISPLDAALVSRIHCRLTAGATEIEVVDLDSTNGTFVNGERVDKRKTVKAGDRIGIGRVDLMVEFTPQAG